MHGTVIIEHSDKAGIIRLNRPDKLNSINMEMVSDIVEALDTFSGEKGTKTVVVTGSGKAFSAGADVRELSQMKFEDVVRGGHLPLWERMRSFRKPVIAAVNGPAVGGGLELVMACDIAIAAKSAKFGQAEINLGIIPGAGGTQRLTRLAGKSRAMEMVLTGRLIGAEEAERFGIVSRVCEDSVLMDEVLELSRRISEHSMFAIELAKESINRAYETNLLQGLDIERRNFIASLVHRDGKEGIDAFLSKRKAEWLE
ncbi:MAG: enoyl-CoA hydratase/isomerase family protein [Thermoplasmata archaeon]|uniref:Enoyl-CoA hydratase/isomerase family protein n=1 Tax=Candidatus Sysuiplasma superficiale TaxID=2823368 RepID=A0A8J7YKM5_9ARCH|nr:enoyl-CoA hydratase/isomerase family protein [Candidatus Sysuiplasma superficiale]MBX8643411.1 enoyl-CoA hydratase/isomerase family protein [Candidatus Sysuiplasma superficiale]